jgi:hypothetical protein
MFIKIYKIMHLCSFMNVRKYIIYVIESKQIHSAFKRLESKYIRIAKEIIQRIYYKRSQEIKK